MSPLVELPGFEEAVKRHSYNGSRELAVFEGDRGCTRCSVGILCRLTLGVQDALFFHGGYGASERRTVDVCVACGRVSAWCRRR